MWTVASKANRRDCTQSGMRYGLEPDSGAALGTGESVGDAEAIGVGDTTLGVVPDAVFEYGPYPTLLTAVTRYVWVTPFATMSV